MFTHLKRWAHKLKTDIVAIYIAGRDRRTPVYAKLIALATAAYAFSPIDLIPDFIPILGLLDDLIIVPIGIMVVIRMIPDELMSEFRSLAIGEYRPTSHWIAGAIVILLWLVVAAWILYVV